MSDAAQLYESHRYSLLKAISWRIVGFVITAIVGFSISGDWKIAAALGVSDSLIKIFAYYGHERAWLRLRLLHQRRSQQPKIETPDPPAPASAPSVSHCAPANVLPH